MPQILKRLAEILSRLSNPTLTGLASILTVISFAITIFSICQSTSLISFLVHDPLSRMQEWLQQILTNPILQGIASIVVIITCMVLIITLYKFRKYWLLKLPITPLLDTPQVSSSPKKIGRQSSNSANSSSPYVRRQISHQPINSMVNRIPVFRTKTFQFTHQRRSAAYKKKLLQPFFLPCC